MKGHSKESLRFGTEAHYADADLYDRTYARRDYDVDFYVGIANELAKGPILELGAGSGRVALPLAREGHQVVALDRMPTMLARLRERLTKEPDEIRALVKPVRGDLFTLKLRTKFSLVIAPFNVFMHLYTRQDVERALATVKRHLAPRGHLVFDVLNPDLRALLRNPTRQFVAGPVKDTLTGEKMRFAEQYAYDPATQIQMITGVMSSKKDPTDVRVMPLAHRQFFPAELEALLHYNGFEVVESWGDFERNPLDMECESQVIVARPRGRRASSPSRRG